MTKHTPGPWRVDGRKITSDKHGLIATVDEWSPEVDAADSALIAAAPDLLEALKEIEALSGPTTAGRARKIARAAIAKAESQP